MPLPAPSTGLTITSPLVLYRSLVATKRIDPDPAQYRLALKLESLSQSLKDYKPVVQYGHRLQQISRSLGATPGRPNASDLQQNAESRGILSSLFKQKKETDGLALTRVLTSHETALELDSPRGLMLHGEVGTGKSMLIDLFADSLPNRKKKRWHYTTFMLETFAKLEQLRRNRHLMIPASLGHQDDYSLLWLARDMISTSPILFLDEFQIPDRAAARIMTNLMTCFFHLGGVLIATSNRLPEDLAKAAGLEFGSPPSSKVDGFAFKRRSIGTTTNRKPEMAAFLEVLRARCEVWEMESRKDYRRREAAGENKTVNKEVSSGIISAGSGDFHTTNAGEPIIDQEKSESGVNAGNEMPRNFFVKPDTADSAMMTRWQVAVERAQSHAVSQTTSNFTPWKATTMRVYGRDVSIPRAHEGVTSWTFAELCGIALGPADYVSLASTYHTLILTDVPILTLFQKNEARRFITLLDALYEARCKLLITAAAGPDDIFFPEASSGRKLKPNEESIDQDATYAETISEVYQDATSPFRPNISTYDPAPEPDYTHARLAGTFSSTGHPTGQLEDTPPNRTTQDDAVMPDERMPIVAAYTTPNFTAAGIFTGEDEKFAFKRARSRLWEMCGARWWARGEDGEDWHRPVAADVRRWERGVDDGVRAQAMKDENGHEGLGEVRDVNEKEDEVLFRHGASPFRVSGEAPPVFGWQHAWGMVSWGKKAGKWGKGPDAFVVDEKKGRKNN